MGGGTLPGKPPVAKRGGNLKRSLFLSSPLGLPDGRIEPILKTPQDFGLRVLGGCDVLSLTNQRFGGDLLTPKIGQIGLQMIPLLAKLSQPFRVESSGMTDLLLSHSQAGEHHFDAVGGVLSLCGGLNVLSER